MALFLEMETAKSLQFLFIVSVQNIPNNYIVGMVVAEKFFPNTQDTLQETFACVPSYGEQIGDFTSDWPQCGNT